MHNNELQTAIENVIATSKDWGEVKHRVLAAYGPDSLSFARDMAIMKRGEDFYYSYEYEAYRNNTNSNKNITSQQGDANEAQRHKIFLSWFNSWQSKNINDRKEKTTVIYDVMQKLGVSCKNNFNKILFAASACIFIGVYWFYYSPLQYETPKNWQANYKDNLQLNFYAKTKLVNKTMYLSLVTDSYPSYLDYSSYPFSNQDGYFTVSFADKDGFELFKYPIQIKSFTTIVNSEGKKSGLDTQVESELSLEKYKRFDHFSITWSSLITVVPAAPIKKEIEQPKPKNSGNDSVDHCAPSLSKTERLRRLALKGKVREVGNREFEGTDPDGAVRSRLRLTWDDKVDQCW